MPDVQDFAATGGGDPAHLRVTQLSPSRFQIDATRGDQGGADPDRRFYTLGLRFIF